MKKITETIEEYFDAVETSKDYYGYFYSTTEAIIIAILGTFCGIIEIPCYSWFTQILGIINPKSFNECFIKWALNLGRVYIKLTHAFAVSVSLLRKLVLRTPDFFRVLDVSAMLLPLLLICLRANAQ